MHRKKGAFKKKVFVVGCCENLVVEEGYASSNNKKDGDVFLVLLPIIKPLARLGGWGDEIGYAGFTTFEAAQAFIDFIKDNKVWDAKKERWVRRDESKVWLPEGT